MGCPKKDLGTDCVAVVGDAVIIAVIGVTKVAPDHLSVHEHRCRPPLLP